MATFAGQLEQYDKAIEKFEQVGVTSLDNNLTKYSAKQYFMNAGLCHLCKVRLWHTEIILNAQDVVTAKRALERYKDLDATFGPTRECQLLQVSLA